MPLARPVNPLSLAAGWLLVLAVGASSAPAATLTASPDATGKRDPFPAALTYIAAPGERNQLSVVYTAGGPPQDPVVDPAVSPPAFVPATTPAPADQTITFHDAGAVITASGLCSSIDAHTASCTGLSFHTARVNLGDEDDAGTFAVPTHVLGGPGDDRLDGSAGPTIEATGGAGNDTLIGSPFDDVLDGRSGDDLIVGGDGSDFITSGRGADRISCGAGDEDEATTDQDDLLLPPHPDVAGNAPLPLTDCETINPPGDLPAEYTLRFSPHLGRATAVWNYAAAASTTP